MPSYNSFSVDKLKGLKSNFNGFAFSNVHKDDKRKLILISSIFLFLLLTTIFWLVFPAFSSPQRVQGQILSSNLITNDKTTDETLNKTKNYDYIDLNNFTGFTINQISNTQSAINTSTLSTNSNNSNETKINTTIHKIKTGQILSLKIPIKTEIDKNNLYLELQVNKELQIVASTMQLIQADKIQNIPASSINTQLGTVSIIPNQLENGLGYLKKDSPAELILDIYIPEKTTEGIYNVDLISNQIELETGKLVTNNLHKASLIVSREDLAPAQSIQTSLVSSTSPISQSQTSVDLNITANN